MKAKTRLLAGMAMTVTGVIILVFAAVPVIDRMLTPPPGCAASITHTGPSIQEALTSSTLAVIALAMFYYGWFTVLTTLNEIFRQKPRGERLG